MVAKQQRIGPVAISVITPCFNAGRLLLELADSLQQQTFKSFEWCIVDDGSELETRNYVESIESNYELDVKIHFSRKAGGNYCRNKGFSLSEGGHVKFVDADDLLEADLLEKQFEVSGRHAKSMVLSRTKVLRTDGSFIVQPLDPALKQSPLRSYLRKPTFMHGGCLLPRHLVETVSGWDESLYAGQDLDFFRRVLLLSPDVQFAESAFIYRQHQVSPRISNLKSNHSQKFESHLKALDTFASILESRGQLEPFAEEMAQNYDIWALKACALDSPSASLFATRARQLAPNAYRSGGKYSKLLRCIFGDRLTAKLMKSSAWKSVYRLLVRWKLWPAS